MFKPSETLIEHIKKHEGFRAKPYDDRGQPAIGYGIRDFDPSLKEVTEEQADKMLRDHLDKISEDIQARVKRTDLSQGQIDSIFDTAYNIGTKKLDEKYNFFNRVNSGDSEDIANFYRTAVKARDEQGNLTPLPGLVKRGYQRAEMWTGKSQPVNYNDINMEAMGLPPVEKQETFENEDAFATALREANSITGQSDQTEVNIDVPETPSIEEQTTPPELPEQIDNNQIDVDTAMQAAFAEATQAQKKGAEVDGSHLKFANETYDQEEFDYIDQSKRLARRIGVSEIEAQAALAEDSFDNIVTRYESDVLARSFPKTSEFARNVENYPLVVQDLEWAKKMEILTNPGISSSYEEDILMAVQGPNAKFMRKAQYIVGRELGIYEDKEFIESYSRIDATPDSDKRLLYQEQVEIFSKKWGIEEKKIDNALQNMELKLAELDARPPVDIAAGEGDSRYAEMIREYMKAGLVTGEAVINMALEIYDNPKGFTLSQLQSISGTATGYLGSIIGAVGGAIIGAVTPVPGGAKAVAGVGAKAAGSLSTAVFSYAEFIEGEIQKKKETLGDKFDLREFMNSAEYREIRKAALGYSAVQAGFEYVTLGMLGKYFKLPVGSRVGGPVKTGLANRIAKMGKKPLKLVAGVAKEGAAQAIGEGTQQYTSTYVADTMLGRDSTADSAARTVESLQEAFGALGTGAVLGPTVAIGKKIIQYSAKVPGIISTGRGTLVDRAGRTGKVLKDAGRALKDYDFVQSTAEAVKNFKGRQYRAKTEEYIKNLVKRNRSEKFKEKVNQQETQQNPNEVPKTKLTDDDIIVESARTAIQDEPQVRMNPKVLKATLSSMDIEAEGFIFDMGDDIVESYQSSLNNDTELTIPLSKWIYAIAEFPEIDAITRKEDSSVTALEAEEIAGAVSQEPEISIADTKVEETKRSFDDDGNPITFAQQEPPKEDGDEQQVEGQDAPPTIPTDIEDTGMDEETIKAVVEKGGQIIPNTEPPTYTQLLEEEGDPDAPVLRRVALRMKFRNQDEIDTFKKLRSQIKAAVNKKWIPEEAAEFIAEVQFRHIRNRASMLGKTTKEVADENFFKAFSKDEYITKPGTLGYFQRTPGRLANSFIAIRKNKKAEGGSKAQLNSLVHEIGHLWLHEMAVDWDYIHSIEDSKMTFEQREYKFAMDKLAEIFEVSDLKELEFYGMNRKERKILDKKIEKIHETFAQTTEKWFLEGEFPESMRRILEGLRRYMRKIADIVGIAYPEYPALKIDKDLNRAFQAISGASSQVDKIMYPMYPTDNVESKLLGAFDESAKATIQDAFSDSVGKVYARVFNRKMNEQLKLMRELEKDAEQQANEELKDSNFSVARSSFDEAYAAFKKGDLDEDPRLSFESVAEVLFDGDTKAAMAWKKTLGIQFVGGSKKKTSTTVQMLMDAMGIRNKDDFKKLIEDADNYEFFRDNRVDELLEEMEPLLKTPEEIHEIVVDELSKIDREKYMRDSFKYMAEQAQTQLKNLVKKGISVPPRFLVNRLDTDAINAKAEKIVAEAKWNHSKPKDFLKLADDEGKKAGSKFADGQFMEALKAKERQAEFYQAFKIAQKYKKEAIKTQVVRDKLLKTSPKALGQNFDVDFIEYLRAVKSIVEPDSQQRLGEEGLIPNIRIPNLTIDHFHNMEMIPPEVIDNINSLKSEFIDSMGAKQVGEVTVDSYRKYMKLNAAVIRAARKTTTVIAEGKRFNAIKVSAETALQIGPRRNNDLKKDSLKTKKFLELSTPKNILIGLMGGEDNYLKSPISKIIKGVTDGSSKVSFEFNEARKEIDAKLRSVERKGKKYSGLKDLVEEFRFSRPVKPITSETLGLTLENGVYDVIGILLNLGSESNREVLLRNGFGEGRKKLFDMTGFENNAEEIMLQKEQDFIKEMVDKGVLTKEHFDFVQQLFDSFKKIHPRSRRAIRNVYGYDIGTIDARKIKTPFGDMAGGYYPLTYASTGGIAQAIEDSGDFVPQLSNDLKTTIPMLNKSFTNSRIKNDRPISLDLTRSTHELLKQYKIAYLLEPMTDLGKIFGTPLFMDTVDKRVPGAKQMFLDWFHMTGGHVFVRGKGNELIDVASRHMRRAVGLNLFIFNFKSMFKQFVGIPQAQQYLKVEDRSKLRSFIYSKRAYGNLAMMVKDPRKIKNSMDRISDLSPFMQDRFKQYAKNLTESFERLDIAGNTLASTTRDASEKLAYLPMQLSQNLVDTAVWDAAFQKGLSKFPNDVSASVEFADNVVRRSQGSTAIADMTRFNFTSEFQKIFKSFTTPVVGQVQRGIELSLETTDDTVPDRVKKYLPWIASSIIIPGILLSLINQGWSAAFGEDDDDEETDIGDVALKASKGVAQEALQVMVYPVGISQVWDFVAEDRPIRPSPVLDIVQRTMMTGKKAVKNWSNDVPLSNREIVSLLDAFTLFTRIPLPTLLGDAYSWYDNLVTPDSQKRFEEKVRRKRLREIKRIEDAQKGKRRRRRR